MTFLQFFLYSTLVNVIYFTLYIAYAVIKAKYLQNKLEKMLKSGEISLLNLDDLQDDFDGGNKKTWN